MAKTFVVPHWTKIVFVWFAFVMFFGMVTCQVNKRMTYRKLYVENLLRPQRIQATKFEPFSLPKSLDGKAFDSTALAGKWALVHFWATWCPPCRQEMPSLEMLSRQFGDRLPVIAISVDEEFGEIKRFFGNQVPAFEVLLDRERKVSSAFGASKFPETFLIGPDGQIKMHLVGQRDWANPEIWKHFEEAIAGQAKTTLAHSS